MPLEIDHESRYNGTVVLAHRINRPSLDVYAWFCIAIGFVIGFQILAVGGYEWPLFREATLSADFMTQPVANPPYLGIILYPFALFPVRVGIFLFSLVSIGCLYAVHRLTGVNKWLLLAIYPALRVLFYSQLDVLTLLGAGLGLWAIRERKPLLVGLAITLLGIKPQVGLVLALVYLVWARDWRVLIVPSIVGILSILRYGFWPVTWPTHVLEFNAWRGNTSLVIFPWGLLIWPIIFNWRRLYTQEQLVMAIVAANLMSATHAEPYSLLTAMAFPHPLWLYPLFTIPLLINHRALLIGLVMVPLYPLIVAGLDRVRLQAGASLTSIRQRQ